MRNKRHLFFTLICVIVLTNCSAQKIEAPKFNADRSFAYLEKQVDFGPRVPGSEESKNCRNYFYEFFDSLNIQIDSQYFSFFDPYSKTELPLVNVIASYKTEKKNSKKILIVAHYDCRPRGEYAEDPKLKDVPIDGANDGASGVAVLMELANMFHKKDPGVDVDLFLTDGEDWGKPGDLPYYCLGAKEFARRGIKGKYEFGILLDMIGDEYQKIYREVYSERFAKEYNDMVWRVAKELNINTFIDTVKATVYDDHLALNAGGVPTIDIIDFDYPYWHTEFDTPDKCSAQSLDNVGRVVLEIIYNQSIWPN